MTENSQSKYEFDAKDFVIGRLASKVAFILQGKNLVSFRPNKSPSLKIIIKNSDQIKVKGNNKDIKEIYHRYTGYSGGLKERSLKMQMQLDSREVIRKAVYNMLPKNRLRSRIITNLAIFKAEAK